MRTHVELVNDLLTNLRSVDKLEQMLGSYSPQSDGKPYTKNFDPEESPSGVLARSGSYNVRSRVIDDDGAVYAGMLPEPRQYTRVLTRSMDRLGMGFQAHERVVNDWRLFFPSSCIVLGDPLHTITPYFSACTSAITLYVFKRRRLPISICL